MAINSKKPLKVRERNGELYVYTNRWIKVDQESQDTRNAKKLASGKTKK